MGRVAPLRLRDGDEESVPHERPGTPGSHPPARTASMNAQKQTRPVYPSDVSRRERAVLVVLESQEDKGYLVEAAQQAGLSPSRLASLLLQKALADLRAGKVGLERRSALVEEYGISDTE